MFESSYSKQADLAGVYNNLGCVYDALGDGRHAESFFKTSLREMSGPTNDAFLNLADHLLKERRYEEAVPLIQTLEKEAPDSVKTLAWRVTVKYILARHYYHLKDYAKALGYLSEILAIDEKDTGAYAGISYIFSEVREDYDDAIRILREGLAHVPKNLALLNNLAYNYLMKGELEKGRKILDQIDEHEAIESTHVRGTRGLLLIKEHAIQEGARFYNIAIRLAKDEETKAQVRQKKNLELGRHFLGQGNKARARKLFLEALKIQSDSEVYRRQAEHLLRLC
ncbi:tetratricopeptide repeat protein [Nitrospiraceae bacterium AH_259_D15_M11_P09]|nr:tetratricopeptide repeat protein [Nitrospiraceae bacterium AH_259_D15_M11_P09]